MREQPRAESVTLPADAAAASSGASSSALLRTADAVRSLKQYFRNYQRRLERAGTATDGVQPLSTPAEQLTVAELADWIAANGGHLFIQVHTPGGNGIVMPLSPQTDVADMVNDAPVLPEVPVSDPEPDAHPITEAFVAPDAETPADGKKKKAGKKSGKSAGKKAKGDRKKKNAAKA